MLFSLFVDCIGHTFTYWISVYQENQYVFLHRILADIWFVVMREHSDGKRDGVSGGKVAANKP